MSAMSALDALTRAVRAQITPAGSGFACPEPVIFAEQIAADLASLGFRVVPADGGAE